MANDVMDDIYFKGRFVGLFKQTSKKHNGSFVFSNIHWTYLKIEECEKLSSFDALTNRTGDYWFSEKIRCKRKFSPFFKTTDVFIPRGADSYYSGDLKNVLIKNLRINHEKTYFLHKDWHEATGDIYFQLIFPPKKKPEVPSDQNKVAGTNIINGPIVINPTGTPVQVNTVPDDVISSSGSIPNLPNRGGVNIINNAPLSSDSSGKGWMSWFGTLFAIIFYALIGYYLWTHFRTLAYIYIGIVLLSLVGQFFKRFRFAGVLSLLAAIAFIAYYLYANYTGIAPDDMDPVKTKKGKVKILPPKPDDKRNGAVASEKEVEWYDFINNFYLAKYKTSEGLFENSVASQQEIRNSIQNASTSAEFYTRFYNGLYHMDDEKINEVAKIFSDSASKKKMDVLQTAEMVITFIQEIPYYLVHDESCEKAVSDGNEFLVEYHREGKPCLPNIAGGVQSPYEFLHNLKGDCDTRSLLGHAILRKLNIASSVWVSEVYGHSILGVAVPAGHGMYKEINGIRHYAVELTAKGYRLGMVSPDQARPDNWDITLYN